MSQAESQKLTANIKSAGCAAKLSAAELAQIVGQLPPISCPDLITGIDNFEDAAVYRLSDDLAVIQTIDFFPPVIDDPYLYGRIAAVNALSDVYAMGGRPVLALNVFCFPTCDYSLEVAQRIIEGGARAVSESRAVLAGGHSIQAAEPIYGLSVMGLVHPQEVLTNAGGSGGDALVLCKPIGTGVALLAHKAEMLSPASCDVLVDFLGRLNGPCLEVARKYRIHAATDITGFGLVGHLHSLAKASGFKAEVDSSAVPLLPEVVGFAQQGFVPAGAYANRKTYSDSVHFDDEVELATTDLFFDPQTSGGLLFAVPPDDAAGLARELQSRGWPAAVIGKLVAGKAGQVEIH